MKERNMLDVLETLSTSTIFALPPDGAISATRIEALRAMLAQWELLALRPELSEEEAAGILGSASEPACDYSECRSGWYCDGNCIAAAAWGCCSCQDSESLHWRWSDASDEKDRGVIASEIADGIRAIIENPENKVERNKELARELADIEEAIYIKFERPGLIPTPETAIMLRVWEERYRKLAERRLEE